MRIFYINFDFPPIGGPGIWRAMAFIKYWRGAGHEITVFCSNRSTWCNRIDESNLEKIPKDVSVFRLKSLLGNDIRTFLTNKQQRTNSSFFKKIYGGLRWRSSKLFPTRVFYWTFAVVIKGLWQARKGRPDIIFSSGPPHDSHIANLILSKLLRTKMVIDYRDLWFDEDIEPEKEKYCGIEHFFEKSCLKHADLVISVSPSWLDHLKNKYKTGYSESKFIVIYNGHDLSSIEFSGENKSIFKETIHLHYNGTTTQGNQFSKEMFEAFKIIRNTMSDKSSVPLVISFSGFSKEFEDFVEKYDLNCFLKDVGEMCHAASIEYSSRADSLLVSVDNYPSTIGRIPGKTYEAMALGKHVFAVLHPGSDLESILQEYGNFTLCSSKSSDEIANSLLSLKEKLSKPQPKPPEGFLEKYSRKNQANKLLNEFEKLLK